MKDGKPRPVPKCVSLEIHTDLPLSSAPRLLCDLMANERTRWMRLLEELGKANQHGAGALWLCWGHRSLPLQACLPHSTHMMKAPSLALASKALEQGVAPATFRSPVLQSIELSISLSQRERQQRTQPGRVVHMGSQHGYAQAGAWKGLCE